MHVVSRQKLTFCSEAKSYISHFVPKRGNEVNITLNSLIDIFTILLIFLLKAYSASGFSMPLTPGINLPYANFNTNPKPTAMISVTRDYIAIDGRKIVSIKHINSGDELIINRLKNSLEIIKSNIIEMGKLNPFIKFTGRVTIEGDKDIPFDLLQKIMFTCSKSGFDNIFLAVIKKT